MISKLRLKPFHIFLAFSLSFEIPSVVMAAIPQALLQSNWNEQKQSLPFQKPETGEQAGTLETHAAPESLKSFPEITEGIYDSAKAKNWSQAQKQFTALQAVHAKLSAEIQPSLQALEAVDFNLPDLNQAIADKNSLKAMGISNRMTLLAIKLTMKYQASQPIQLSMLDYLGRALELGAFTQNISKIHNVTCQLSQVWESLKPSILEHGGETQAQKFDALLKEIVAAKKMQDYRHLAAMELEQVDGLEKVLEK